MDRAAEHLEASLEPHRAEGWQRFTHLAGAAIAVASGEMPSLSDLVVRRRDTGAEVVRTKADVGDAELLLARARRDLREMSIAEFAAAWRPQL